MLALTATATPEVRHDIERQLDLRDPVIQRTVERPSGASATASAPPAMMRYAQAVGCRGAALRHYFGEAVSPGWACGHCDVCRAGSPAAALAAGETPVDGP